MKTVYKFIFIGLAIISLTACTSGNTEFRPKEIWKDTNGNPINAHGGGVMYWNGSYYWYGEIKKGSTSHKNGQDRTEVVGVSCYSSSDLLNWKNEGIALAARPDSVGHDLHPTMVVERPKVIYNPNTGKFVMWMHIDSSDYLKAMAGVAVADSPAGPFTYIGSFRPNGEMSRDQTLFVDDDGTAYQIASSEENKTLHINRLNKEFTKPDGVFTRIFPDKYREAPAMFKFENKYYLLSSGCSGWDPNQAELAVADSIMGEWTVLGNPCKGPDADITFYGQSTHVIQVAGKDSLFIACFDMWKSSNLSDSRYIWLPVNFNSTFPEIHWKDSWSF